jgi:hypothetical protein
LAGDAVSLRTFLALDDIEDDFLTLFEAFVTVFLNRAEMDEYVITVIPPKEAIALEVVKPLHCAFILSHRNFTFSRKLLDITLPIGRFVQAHDAFS